MLLIPTGLANNFLVAGDRNTTLTTLSKNGNNPGAEITSINFLSLLFPFHSAGLNSGAGGLCTRETRKMPCFLSAQHLRRKELFLMDLYDFPQKGPCLALTGSHEHSSWEMAVSGDGGGDGDLGSIPRTTQNERGKGKLLTRHGQKVNIHGCQPPLQFHLPALLTLQHPPPPNGCHTRLHHRSMLYPLSKMTSLSCFRPSAWQDWLSVILTLHSPTKPAWLQQPKRICVQID